MFERLFYSPPLEQFVLPVASLLSRLSKFQRRFVLLRASLCCFFSVSCSMCRLSWVFTCSLRTLVFRSPDPLNGSKKFFVFPGSWECFKDIAPPVMLRFFHQSSSFVSSFFPLSLSLSDFFWPQIVVPLNSLSFLKPRLPH